MKTGIFMRCFAMVFVGFLLEVPAATAAYVSLENGQRNQAARELYDSRAVLSSTETEPVARPYVIRQEADKARGILVSYGEEGFTGTFVVRQEAIPGEVALTNKPAELDMRIVRLIDEAQIRSIEDYAAWLQEHFVYKKDEGPDVWALPEETMARRFGDCEDFAFLNAAVLRVFGYKPIILGLGGGLHTVNHAICAFNKDGHYFWFDNIVLKKTDDTSRSEFARRLLAGQGYAYIYEIRRQGVPQGVVAEDTPREIERP